MALRGNRSIPRDWKVQSEANQRMVDQIRDLQEGRGNNVFDVTLAVAPATTTTLEHPLIHKNRRVLIAAQTANAAAALATTWPSITGRILTLNHASSALADRTFTITIVG